jgi:hypothetical protein
LTDRIAVVASDPVRADISESNGTFAHLHGFNWGAFFLTWIWALGNRSLDPLTIMLCAVCLLPYVGWLGALALMLYSGLTGTRRAARNRLWDSEAHFIIVQRRWAIIGIVQLIVLLIFLIVAPFVVAR